jgi:hypothetical protein
VQVIVRAKAKKEGADGGGWVSKGSPLSKQISFLSYSPDGKTYWR